MRRAGTKPDFAGGRLAAGIDFGPKLLAELQDEKTAKTAQPIIEYDPLPPFQAGTPDVAGADVKSAAMQILGDMDEQMTRTLSARAA